MAGIKCEYLLNIYHIIKNTPPHFENVYFIFLFHIHLTVLLFSILDKYAALVTLAFAGSIGMTLVILACALPSYGLWYPFLVVLFYITAPIPTLLAKRYTENQTNACLEMAIFLTMGIVVSSFALPLVLARAPDPEPTIKWGACYLTLAGNVVVYLTLYGFFITFDQDDDYNMW